MNDSPQKLDPHLPDSPPRHLSFLLRCMETRTQIPAQSQPGSNWRFSLQDPKYETVHSFRDFEALVAFLQNLLDESHTLPTEKGDDIHAA